MQAPVDATAITGAIEVRGILVGLAARRVPGRGSIEAEAARFEANLADGDALFAKGTSGEWQSQPLLPPQSRVP